jgi:signal transduction histidine kinase
VFANRGTAIGDTEPVSLAELAPEPWSNLDTEAATLDVAFEGQATLPANSNRLTSLLENLYHNAIEHGGSDVTVTIGPLDGFYVADDGMGLSQQETDRIFEAGYTIKDDGTGLGLAIVEQVVTEHGWDIDVEATTEGARFEITGVGLVD